MKPFVQIAIIIPFLFISCNINNKKEISEKWKQEIVDTEHEFAEMAKNEGIAKAFLTFAADDAVLMRNNNLIIGLHNGWVLVRSLSDLDGTDDTPYSDFTAGDLPVIAVIPMPEVTGGPTCEQEIAQGNIITGDFNRDCYVDIKDFAIFSMDWAKCNDPNDASCTW